MSLSLARLASSVVFAGLALPALADTPKVVTDIAPVHGLVAAVMEGVGSPDLLLPPGSSPHDYALRPSEARMLQGADLVVWIGEGLTPWLESPLENLAAKAENLELLAAPGTELLGWDEEALHDHDHEAHDAHDHEEHADDEDHDEHAHDAGHDEHDHEHDDAAQDHEEAHDHGHADAHGHDHGEFDPHAWLSPHNAVAWVGVIAEELGHLDPDNAATYKANADAFAARIGEVEAEVTAALAPVSDTPYVVQHDAYRYFEAEFPLSPLGAIADSDANAPGPARVAALRDAAAEAGAVCVFAEPQYTAGIAETVSSETGARLAVLDPLGAEIEIGPDFYPALLTSMAASLSDCLAGGNG